MVRVNGALRRISEELAKHGIIVASPTSLAAVLDGIGDAHLRARNEGLDAAARRAYDFVGNARAMQAAVSTPVMKTKWAGVAEAMEDLAEELRSMKEDES